MITGCQFEMQCSAVQTVYHGIMFNVSFYFSPIIAGLQYIHCTMVSSKLVFNSEHTHTHTPREYNFSIVEYEIKLHRWIMLILKNNAQIPFQLVCLCEFDFLCIWLLPTKKIFIYSLNANVFNKLSFNQTFHLFGVHQGLDESDHTFSNELH